MDHGTIATASAALALICIPATASAQAAAPAQTATPVSDTAPEAMVGFESDIIVTARKREESIQDVPLSIAAISGDTLQRQSIASFENLSTSLSGVGVTRSANNIVTFYIRGLGTGPGADSFEQSVALFVDGTYAGRPAEYNGGLFDAERVEIIKGTQAALLGKNTSLGAVSVTTRKPGNEFKVDFVGTYDLAYGSRDLELGIDVPITDNLAVRVAGQSNLQTGFLFNPLTDKKYQRSNALAGRIVAVWKPTADFDATVLYQQYNTTALGTGEEYIYDIFGNARARSIAEGYNAFETRLDRVTARSDSRFGDPTETTSGERAISTLNYRLGGYTLTSVTAYSDFAQIRASDYDNLPGDYISVPVLNNNNNQITQEVRLTSPSENRFNFVAGLFFLRENWHYARDYISTRGNLPAGYKDATAAGPSLSTVSTGSFSERFDLRTTTYSAFGQANLELNDWLTLNLGLRGTSEKREAHYNRTSTNLVGSVALTFAPLAPTSEGFTATNLDGSAGFQIKPSKGKLFYGSFSRGTKGGGYFNSPAKLTGNERYKPEVADTFEVGTKLTFGQSFFNLALFQTNVKNYQQSVFTGVDFISPQQDLKAKGVEVEGRFPVSDSFRVGATVTYLDAKRQDVVTPINNNTPPLNAPKWSGDISAQYTRPISNDLRFTADADVYFKSPVYYTLASATIGGIGAPATAVIPKGDSYALLNGRLAIASESGGWEVGIVGKNILNRLYLSYARAGALLGGTALGTAGAPRTVALQFILHR